MRWAEMDGAKQRVQGRWRYWSGPGCPGGLQEARLKIILSFVLFSSVGIQPVAGQDVAARTQSFETLPLVLAVGQEVQVRDETGHLMHGKVVSITNSQLVISRKPFLRPRVQQGFGRDIIRRIDLVDSRENGALLGGAAAVGLVATGIKFGCTATCERTGSWFIGIATLVPIGIGVGAAIDSLINRTVYEGGSQKSRAVVAPWIEWDRKGVLARVFF